ncbi:hypothetical protein MASR2M15_10300 [Anaerolineales bacterium]
MKRLIFVMMLSLMLSIPIAAQDGQSIPLTAARTLDGVSISYPESWAFEEIDDYILFAEFAIDLQEDQQTLQGDLMGFSVLRKLNLPTNRDTPEEIIHEFAGFDSEVSQIPDHTYPIWYSVPDNMDFYTVVTVIDLGDKYGLFRALIPDGEEGTDVFIDMLFSIAPLDAASANGQAVSGVSVKCPNGHLIDQGVEVVVNMRAGFTYTATAVGLNGFDPVLAVKDEFGNILCDDDTDAAFSYNANLPTTGLVLKSNLSAQMPFTYSGSGFGDISLIVGGYNSAEGEFILFIEGMVVSSNDGAGDPLSVYVTPNLTASGLPISAYMISVTDGLDPLIYVIDDKDEVLTLEDYGSLYCDDAGSTDNCFGESQSLVGSYISRTAGRELVGGPRDAMMSFPVALYDNGPEEAYYLPMRFTSYQIKTTGDYVAVFHMGTANTYYGE